MRAGIICAVCVAAVVTGFPIPSAASDLQQTVGLASVDAAVFGYGGLRGIGSGSITVSGVSGTVQAAYLYWHGPTLSSDRSVLEDVVFDGVNLVGVFLGESADNCWGFNNSYAYYADVTSEVTGNGTYAFSFPGFSLDSVELNGASLLVVYDDGNDANDVDLVVFAGNDSNVSNSYDADGWNATLDGIEYVSGAANMLLIVSDGQGIVGPPPLGEDDQVLVNGTEMLSMCGLHYQGDSVPSGAGCPFGFGCLWDQRTVNVAGQLVPGQNTLTLTTARCASGSADCVSLIAAVFIMPPGSLSVPGIPAIGTIGAGVLVLLVLGAGAVVLRRMG